MNTKLNTIWTPTIPKLIERFKLAVNHPSNNKRDDWTDGYRQGLQDALDTISGNLNWVFDEEAPSEQVERTSIKSI